MPAWLSLLGEDEGREVAVTDRGLRVGSTVHPWNRFERAAWSDAELALYRRGRLRHSLSVDPADIEDERAVRAALARHLPVD